MSKHSIDTSLRSFDLWDSEASNFKMLAKWSPSYLGPAFKGHLLQFGIMTSLEVGRPRTKFEGSMVVSVTKFGKIPPLWQICKICGNILKVYLVLGKVFDSLWHNLYAFGQLFIAVNGQILKTQSGDTVNVTIFGDFRAYLTKFWTCFDKFSKTTLIM